jgi:hypothetical protein
MEEKFWIVVKFVLVNLVVRKELMLQTVPILKALLPPRIYLGTRGLKRQTGQNVLIQGKGIFPFFEILVLHHRWLLRVKSVEFINCINMLAYEF